MRMILVLFLTIVPNWVFSQEKTEMIGQLGNRPTLLVLHSTRGSDGAARLTGEYIVLPSLERRFVDGEASPEIGVTTLREGMTPILFGREPIGELRGTLRGGTFKGMRYGPGGQERERFEFSEEFPDMAGYSANVRCEARGTGYSAHLGYRVEAGKLQQFEWRTMLSPSGHSCAVTASQQQTFAGGLRFTARGCGVTLRDLGEYIRVSAESCAALCGSQAYFEPVLVDRRGACRLMLPEPKAK